MYNVTLINLTTDARAVAAQAHVERPGLGPDALGELLRNFCAVDPVENSAVDTAIRVQVRHESYLLRTENRKLILYDAQHRDLPGQVLTVEEAMHELDGSASAARQQAVLQTRVQAGTAAEPTGPALPVTAPPPAASRRRIIALTIAAALLLAANVWLSAPFAARDTPPGFIPVAGAELAGLHARLSGVYLTGAEPGQHGIVVTGPGEMKLFELAAVEAPRVIYAAYWPGRIGAGLFLATDQPGGLIEVAADGQLVYCGETYRRIP